MLPHSLRFRGWGHAVGLLLLAGYLIFCHGCHGEDVDDELCVPPPLLPRQREAEPPRSQAPTGNENSDCQRGTSIGNALAKSLNALSPVLPFLNVKCESCSCVRNRAGSLRLSNSPIVTTLL